ncbi:hypothetical protein Tco_0422339 [Tanacetum coccineum]
MILMRRLSCFIIVSPGSGAVAVMEEVVAAIEGGGGGLGATVMRRCGMKMVETKVMVAWWRWCGFEDGGDGVRKLVEMVVWCNGDGGGGRR